MDVALDEVLGVDLDVALDVVLAVLSDEVLGARLVAYSASESDLALDTLSCETSISIEQCNVSYGKVLAAANKKS